MSDDPVEDFALLAPVDRDHVLAKMKKSSRRVLLDRWWRWALRAQRMPPGKWRIWLIRAGRGFGKTRAGAEWVSALARENPRARIALVAATADDARRVMIEGESGLFAVARDNEPIVWHVGPGELTFASGAKAFVYSARAPEALRGPQHHAAWCDELGKWHDGEKAWDNLLMGLRIGDNPQALITTTPRQTKLMRRIVATEGMVETRGRTRDNPHLPASFVAAMEDDYAGTRLGRQELDGEMIDDVEGALWTRAGLEACRVARKRRPAAARVVVAVDPPAGIGGDACGIVAAMLGADGVGYVIEDASVSGLSPSGWARVVARCARRHRADRVVAEVNNGGEMVREVLSAVAPELPIRTVRASHGKAARAEPVSALYDQGRVKHLGAFPQLEDEMCGLSAEGYAGPGRSPDRADALVWALTELMLRKRPGRAAVRVL
ncbi:MAG: terminase family protein [Pseudomonadota bacterium]